MKTNPSLPVSDANLSQKERNYLLEAFDSGRISGSGPFVDRFEQGFAAYCGASHAVSCANGTVALHLAMLAMGIGPGDEVIVPSLTYVATANAVSYCGAKPVFADCDVDTWNISAGTIEPLVNSKTRGIIIVHLYGNPVDCEPIAALARERGLWLVEDAAQAHGAKYMGQPVGSFGDLASFSFYGNKILTTGEGGMVTTSRPDLAEKMKLLRGQGMDPERRYWFPVIGYNYRLTNLQAAIGVAQLERAEDLTAARRQLAGWYKDAFNGSRGISLQHETPGAQSAWWLFGVVFTTSTQRENAAKRLEREGIETRPFFPALHTLPPYYSANRAHGCPVSNQLGACGLSLPSGAHVTQSDVTKIASILRLNA